MRVTVKKWGNSASIRIPASIMETTKLHIDAVVDIREEGGRIVIESIPQPGHDLDALIAGITSENLHGEIDTGLAMGKENL